MIDHLTIPKDSAQAGIVQFVESSALAHCTTFDSNWSDGAVTVSTSWDVEGFSSGERIAWSTLASLINGDLRTFLDRLDADNIGALIACLAMVRAELVVGAGS